MADRPAPGASADTISAELIENRGFTVSRRGFDQSEVKEFLQVVAGAVRALHERVDSLRQDLSEAEFRVNNPKLDEDTLMRLVGDETGSILRTARATAAEMSANADRRAQEMREAVERECAQLKELVEREVAELRARAEHEMEVHRATQLSQVLEERERAERETAELRSRAASETDALRARAKAEAARLVDEANLSAGELRERAESALARATEEADQAAARIRSTATEDAEQIVRRARTEAEVLRAQAEHDRKLTVEGAQALREKILTDLTRRRRVASTQVEQLRAGRERLLQSYGLVRRTLEEINDELHRADEEARRAAAEAGAAYESKLGDDAVAPDLLAAVPLPASLSGGVGEVSGEVGEISGEAGEVSGEAGEVSGEVGEVSGEVGKPSPDSWGVPAGTPEADAADDPGGGRPGTGDRHPVSPSPPPLATGEARKEPAAAGEEHGAEAEPEPSTEADSAGSPAGSEVAGAGVDVDSVGSPAGSAVAEVESAGSVVADADADSAESRPAPELADADSAESRPAPELADADSAESRPAPELADADSAESLAAPALTGAVATATGARQRPGAQAGVDDLFARLRAGREVAVSQARTLLEQPPSDVDAVSEVADSEEDVTDAEDNVADAEDNVADAAEADAARGQEPVSPSPVPRRRTDVELEPARSDQEETWLQRRDEALGPVELALTRRLKRAIQDEQNDLLDRLRSLRIRPTPDTVLPPLAEQQDRFSHAAAGLIDQAAQAGVAFALGVLSELGRKTAPPGTPAAMDEVDEQLATEIVTPLRHRLTETIDANGDDDQAVLVEALGGAYREWKTQRLERIAGDALADAFARGVIHATPEAVPLQWVVDDVDGPCPDCDDNVLAGALPREESFPTGQLHPPAHAGCRCIVVPSA